MNGIPTGWKIVYNPKPIPDSQFDYDFHHDEYDGENGMLATPHLSRTPSVRSKR